MTSIFETWMIISVLILMIILFIIDIIVYYGIKKRKREDFIYRPPLSVVEYIRFSTIVKVIIIVVFIINRIIKFF